MWLNEQIYGFQGPSFNSQFWSFPSGHTSTIMGLVIGLAILFPRRGYFLIGCGLLLVSTRILLLHHYLSDVLMAGYLVVLELGLLTIWLEKKSCFKNIDSQSFQ